MMKTQLPQPITTRDKSLSNKSWNRALGAVISVLLVSCSGNAPQAGARAVPVPIATVETGIVTDSSDYVANLQSRQSVTLQPRVDGYVLEIYVKAGDRVEAGAPILRIDPAKQQAALQQSVAVVASSQADFENARATLAQLQATKESTLSSLDFNQKEFKRYSDLVSQGAFAREKLDDVSNNLRSAKADLGKIEAQIEAQKASINSAATKIEASRAGAIQQEVQLDFYTVTAPFAGIVGDIPVKVGDNVSSTLPTQLTTITQNQVLEIQISVPVENAPRLKMGQPVELLDTQDKPLVKGNIAFISPNISPQNQSVLVKANFNNANNQLKANQFVRARLIWSTRSGILVPTSAISRLGGQDFIFVAETSPDGKSLIANQKPVKLGKITGNNQEVLEGLTAKDKVVTGNILQLRNGAAIMDMASLPKN